MDTRVGFPGEHLAGDTNNSNPIFSTAVGLVMKAIENNNDKNELKSSIGNEISEQRKTVLSKWGEKFKKFIEESTSDNN
jgi:cell division ATPase FtsA